METVHVIIYTLLIARNRELVAMTLKMYLTCH